MLRPVLAAGGSRPPATPLLASTPVPSASHPAASAPASLPSPPPWPYAWPWPWRRGTGLGGTGRRRLPAALAAASAEAAASGGDVWPAGRGRRRGPSGTLLPAAPLLPPTGAAEVSPPSAAAAVHLNGHADDATLHPEILLTSYGHADVSATAPEHAASNGGGSGAAPAHRTITAAPGPEPSAAEAPASGASPAAVAAEAAAAPEGASTLSDPSHAIGSLEQQQPLARRGRPRSAATAEPEPGPGSAVDRVAEGTQAGPGADSTPGLASAVPRRRGRPPKAGGSSGVAALRQGQEASAAEPEGEGGSQSDEAEEVATVRPRARRPRKSRGGEEEAVAPSESEGEEGSSPGAPAEAESEGRRRVGRPRKARATEAAPMRGPSGEGSLHAAATESDLEAGVSAEAAPSAPLTTRRRVGRPSKTVDRDAAQLPGALGAEPGPGSGSEGESVAMVEPSRRVGRPRKPRDATSEPAPMHSLEPDLFPGPTAVAAAVPAPALSTGGLSTGTESDGDGSAARAEVDAGAGPGSRPRAGRPRKPRAGVEASSAETQASGGGAAEPSDAAEAELRPQNAAALGTDVPPQASQSRVGRPRKARAVGDEMPVALPGPSSSTGAGATQGGSEMEAGSGSEAEAAARVLPTVARRRVGRPRKVAAGGAAAFSSDDGEAVGPTSAGTAAGASGLQLAAGAEQAEAAGAEAGAGAAAEPSGKRRARKPRHEPEVSSTELEPSPGAAGPLLAASLPPPPPLPLSRPPRQLVVRDVAAAELPLESPATSAGPLSSEGPGAEGPGRRGLRRLTHLRVVHDERHGPAPEGLTEARGVELTETIRLAASLAQLEETLDAHGDVLNVINLTAFAARLAALATGSSGSRAGLPGMGANEAEEEEGQGWDAVDEDEEDEEDEGEGAEGDAQEAQGTHGADAASDPCRLAAQDPEIQELERAFAAAASAGVGGIAGNNTGTSTGTGTGQNGAGGAVESAAAGGPAADASAGAAPVEAGAGAGAWHRGGVAVAERQSQRAVVVRLARRLGELVQARILDLDPEGAVTMLYVYGRIRVRHEILPDLVYVAGQNVDIYHAQAVSNLVWALAALQPHSSAWAGRGWWEGLFMCSEYRLGSYPTQALANLMWALGKLRQRPPAAWQRAFFAAAAARMSLFTSQGVANLVQGAAKLRLRMPPYLLEELMKFGASHLRLFSHQGLVLYAWGMARLMADARTPREAVDPWLEEAVLPELARRMPSVQLATQQLGRLQRHGQGGREREQRRAQAQDPAGPGPGPVSGPAHLDLRQLATSLYALSLLRYCPNQRLGEGEDRIAWMRIFWAATRLELERAAPGAGGAGGGSGGCTAQALSNLLHAAAELRLQVPPPLLAAAMERSHEALERGAYTPEALSSLAWSLHRMGATPPPDWAPAFLAAAWQALPYMAPSELATMLYGASRLVPYGTGRGAVRQDWLARAEGEWAQCLDRCGPVELYRGLSAFALWRHTPGPHWQAAFARQLAARLTDIPDWQTSHFVQFLADVGAAPPLPLLNSLVAGAVARRLPTAKDLARIVYGLARMGRQVSPRLLGSLLSELQALPPLQLPGGSDFSPVPPPTPFALEPTSRAPAAPGPDPAASGQEGSQGLLRPSLAPFPRLPSAPGSQTAGGLVALQRPDRPTGPVRGSPQAPTQPSRAQEPGRQASDQAASAARPAPQDQGGPAGPAGAGPTGPGRGPPRRVKESALEVLGQPLLVDTLWALATLRHAPAAPWVAATAAALGPVLASMPLHQLGPLLAAVEELGTAPAAATAAAAAVAAEAAEAAEAAAVAPAQTAAALGATGTMSLRVVPPPTRAWLAAAEARLRQLEMGAEFGAELAGVAAAGSALRGEPASHGVSGMTTASASQCAGCRSEFINSGYLWFDNGKAELCCNKRCAARAQRRLQELRDGTPRSRKPRAHGPPPPLDDVPIEAETGWASLSAEVLSLVGSRLGGLRDRLSAALVCRHWREQLTKGATHARLVMEDCDGPSGGVEAAVGLLDSGRALMPQVRSVDVSVPWRCRGPDSLLRQVHALSRWTQLQSLSVEWDIPAAEASAAEAAVTAAAVARHIDRFGVSVAGSFEGMLYSLSNPPDDGRQPAVLSALCLGALGRLTGLRRLSLAARLGGPSDTREEWFGPPGVGAGLYALSALTRLTELELRQPPPAARGVREDWDDDERPVWSPRDADLSALTALRSLTASAEIASPPLLEGLQACSRLTRLVLTDVDATNYERWSTDSGQIHFYDWDRTAEALGALTHLRFLRVAFAPVVPHDWHNATGMVVALAQALRALMAKQAQAQAQQAQAVPGAAQAQGQALGGHASPRPRPGASSTPRVSLTGGPLPHPEDVDDAAQPSPCGPLEIEIDLRPACPKWPAFPSTSPRYSADSEERTAWASARPAAPRVHLDEELVEGLTGLTGMRRLELDFDDGEATNLTRLTSLTRLTHLALRFQPKVPEPPLTPLGVHQLATSLPQLTTLTLELPAVCLTPAALQYFELCHTLTRLDLTAHAVPRQVPYGPWDVRQRLLKLAAREFGPGPGAGPAAAGEAVPPSAAVVAAVDRCVEPLMWLQQLFLTHKGDAHAVKYGIQEDAESRRQQAQDAAAAAAAAALLDDAAADVLAFFAAAAGAPAVAGPPAPPPPEAAVAEAALAEAMPLIPAWTLLSLDDPNQGPDASAAAAAVWLAGLTSTPAELAALEAAAATAADISIVKQVPLDKLTIEDLEQVRALLTKDEIVRGPVFRVGAWAPRGLQELRLRGFEGLSFSAASGCTGAGAGAGGGSSGGAGGGGSRLVAMLALRRLALGVQDEAACGKVMDAVVGWASVRGRAPVLEAAAVTVWDPSNDEENGE
ncbi:hypothetical protein HYH03_001642 [Edaphochlamys debaryana]|uniref:F-box domain-containing protein n=1 Tax=Edaphochlamys debaryana TaxID=47281 RepID=A0A835YDD8_9CHLO|nr:hypothetical protein HYH03_001642 [Edaphochlamys debaryana]|eukprot:KAG2500882.1 hypothetical protein HYH03_001642 [Edaphochlamys debaryana]